MKHQIRPQWLTRLTSWGMAFFSGLAVPWCMAQFFANPSFESVPSADGTQLGQGLLPADWIDAANIRPGGDSYGPGGDFGLGYGEFNHFATRQPIDGKRWFGGADFGFAQEALAQALTLPPSTTFVWSGALLCSGLYTSARGGWDLALATTPSVDDPALVRVASLPGSANSEEWVTQSVRFTTPDNAGAFKFVILIPRSGVPGLTSYGAIDNVSLVRADSIGPVLKGFSPTEGGAGDTLTVFGTGLLSTRAVSVGGVRARFQILPTGVLLVAVPDPALAGPVAVRTTEGVAETQDAFRPTKSWETPLLADFFPVSGPSGTTVTFNGSGLAAITAVKLGGGRVEFLRLPAGRLQVTLPAGAVSGAFELVHDSGVILSKEAFEVTPLPVAPTVDNLLPGKGAVGDRVIIAGTRLEAVLGVSFGGVPAPFARINDTQLEATVPEGAITGVVAVTTESGMGTSAEVFRVNVAPATLAIADFSRWRVEPGGSVLLRGPGLGRAREVTLNGKVVSFVTSGGDELQVTIPSDATSGWVSVLTDQAVARAEVPLVVRPADVPQPQPGPVTAQRIQGDQLRIAFPVEALGQYVLERTDALEPGGWEPLETQRPREEPGTVEVTDSFTHSESSFYRVVTAAPFASNWDFEQGMLGWTVSGTAFAQQPVRGEAYLRSQAGPPTVQNLVGGDYWDTAVHLGHHGDSWLSSGQEHPELDSPILSHPSSLDVRTGRAVSVRFRIERPWISALIGGRMASQRPADRSPRLELWVQPASEDERANWAGRFPVAEAGYHRVALWAVGVRDDELFRRVTGDVTRFRERLAKIAVVDDATDGHIHADDIRFHSLDPRPDLIAVGDLYRDPDAPVWGFADTHTHPAANLGFGGKLIAGSAFAPGAAAQALRSCEHAHGINGGNACFPTGILCVPSILMETFTGGFRHATGGYEYGFDGWPNVVEQGVHQQMYVDWIRRAWQGGLRLMVAMAVHNRLLADINFSDGEPKDDIPVAARQLREIRALVERHSDFMEIALDPHRAREIIHRGKLAVVLGIEQDQMFLGREDRDISPEALRSRIDEAYETLGVRHVFPVHFADNPYGGFAMYNSLWFYNSHWLNGGRYPDVISPAAAGIMDDIRWRFEAEGGLQLGTFFLGVAAFTAPPGYIAGPQVNARRLQPTGRMLLRELMRRGMIIDVDHMGVLTKNDALDVFQAQGYPPISGHSGFSALALPPWESGDRSKWSSEGDLVPSIVDRLSRMGGMVSPITLAKDVLASGGTVPNDAPGSAKSYAQVYLHALEKFGGTNLALSTDFGMVHGSTPRFGLKAMFPLRHDLRRKGLAQEFLARQTNGVRYATPIRDYREHRFRPPSDNEYYNGEQREYWEAIALFQAGADPDGPINPGPRTGRIRHLSRGLRADTEASLAVALSNLPVLPGDAPHEIRAAYYVRNGLSPRPGDHPRVPEIFGGLSAIWRKWQDMNGDNRPLRRCVQASILDANRARPYLKEWDINLDGMAHYGLLPDFLQDLRNCGLTPRQMRPLFRSAEDYIRLWERCQRNAYRGP